MTTLVSSLGQSALNLALNTLQPYEVLTVVQHHHESKAILSRDDLIKRLALELKQYELDLERNQLRQDSTTKYVSHLSNKLEN
jgi:hypothetical protein